MVKQMFQAKSFPNIVLSIIRNIHQIYKRWMFSNLKISTSPQYITKSCIFYNLSQALEYAIAFHFFFGKTNECFVPILLKMEEASSPMYETTANKSSPSYLSSLPTAMVTPLNLSHLQYAHGHFFLTR